MKKFHVAKFKRVKGLFRRRERTGRTKQEHDHAKQRNTGELGLVVEYEGGKNSNKSWEKAECFKV